MIARSRTSLAAPPQPNDSLSANPSGQGSLSDRPIRRQSSTVLRRPSEEHRQPNPEPGSVIDVCCRGGLSTDTSLVARRPWWHCAFLFFCRLFSFYSFLDGGGPCNIWRQSAIPSAIAKQVPRPPVGLRLTGLLKPTSPESRQSYHSLKPEASTPRSLNSRVPRNLARRFSAACLFEHAQSFFLDSLPPGN